MALAGVDVISVTYNSSEEIARFYQSLNQQHLPFDVHFVDNHSHDGTVALLQSFQAADARVHVIANAENVGLAAANNQPLGQLQHEFVAIINPDIILLPDTLATLVRYLEDHPDVVAVGPLNTDQHGVAHSSFHRAWSMAHVIAWRMLPMRLTQAIYRPLRHFREQDVLFVSGSCLVTRRRAFEQVGGYDPEYFLTVEDVCDLCLRLKQATGGAIRLVPQAKAVHLRHRSVASAPFVAVWQGARGSIYHFRKHHGLFAGLTVSALLLVNSALRAALSFVLSPFSARFARDTRNHARVCLLLLRENPLWASREALGTPVETEP